MQNFDDTQPVKPVMIMPDDEPRSGGPGCLLIGIVGLGVVIFAAVIIGLAGFAGWSSGQRIAQSNATATTNAVIVDQMNRIQADIASKNLELVKVRLQYLVTLTPGVAGVDELAITATALAQPTATPQPTATQAVVVPQETQAATNIPLVIEGSATPDLNPLLQQAQAAVGTSDWDTAIDTLDAIMGYDPDFQVSTVNALMFQALTSKALAMYRGGDSSRLAEANQLTDRASLYGNIETSEVNYESLIASLYLDAINAVGVDYNLAIRKLTSLYGQAPGYRDVFQLLVNQYIGYGDTQVAIGQPCSAVAQYQGALSLRDDITIVGKRDSAQLACTNQQQGLTGGTLDPNATPGGIAPVGVAPVGSQ